jgi:glycogen debranching enzyme
LEWGGHAILECVRDGFNAVYDLFGGTADVPRRFEALDLSLMMVKELRSLEAMAAELQKMEEAREWKERAERLSQQINETLWDSDSGFYYHVAADTHRMELDGKSLKRKEIIGFLPLWAGVASREQAGRLLEHLKNPRSFSRRFGIPTLAADDPHYNPYVTRCCQWNGAVWLLWDYLVFRGLLDYGYRLEAEDVYRRVLAAVAWQLRANHRFWESYSPDYALLQSPMSYLWDSIIARFMIDLAPPYR